MSAVRLVVPFHSNVYPGVPPETVIPVNEPFPNVQASSTNVKDAVSTINPKLSTLIGFEITVHPRASVTVSA